MHDVDDRYIQYGRLPFWGWIKDAGDAPCRNILAPPEIDRRPRLKLDKAHKSLTKGISCRGRLTVVCLRLDDPPLLGNRTVLVSVGTRQSHASIRNARGWQEWESVARHDCEPRPFMAGAGDSSVVLECTMRQMV